MAFAPDKRDSRLKVLSGSLGRGGGQPAGVGKTGHVMGSGSKLTTYKGNGFTNPIGKR